MSYRTFLLPKLKPWSNSGGLTKKQVGELEKRFALKQFLIKKIGDY